MIAVPETFARSTIEREGDPGAGWIAELPAIVGGLLARWDCVPDGDVMHGGVGVIVPVRHEGHAAAVLKVSFPHPGNVHEPDAFAVWGGRGAVLLHKRDDERFLHHIHLRRSVEGALAVELVPVPRSNLDGLDLDHTAAEKAVAHDDSRMDGRR